MECELERRAKGGERAGTGKIEGMCKLTNGSKNNWSFPFAVRDGGRRNWHIRGGKNQEGWFLQAIEVWRVPKEFGAWRGLQVQLFLFICLVNLWFTIVFHNCPQSDTMQLDQSTIQIGKATPQPLPEASKVISWIHFALFWFSKSNYLVKQICPFPSKEEDETDTSEDERIKKDGFCRQLKYGGCQKNSELDVYIEQIKLSCIYYLICLSLLIDLSHSLSPTKNPVVRRVNLVKERPGQTRPGWERTAIPSFACRRWSWPLISHATPFSKSNYLV